MSEIKESFTEFVAAHPKMKFMFFGGKGGVGKTTMAGVTALHLAREGKRTMLASTNPVHSLSGLLDQNVYGAPTQVTGVPNLWAYEIDTKETIERSKQDIKTKIRWFLKFAEISTQADAFVESATMNPAFEESAMFENMVDLMLKNEYDAYVFDTAPTANARRLLGMSKVYSLWVNKMVKSRAEAQSLRELLSFTKKKQTDPLMEYLVSFRERILKARELAHRRRANRVLLRHPAGGVAHRRDQALHQLVPRFRYPGRRGHREHGDSERPGQARLARVRPQPGRHAGWLHGGNLARLRQCARGGASAGQRSARDGIAAGSCAIRVSCQTGD